MEYPTEEEVRRYIQRIERKAMNECYLISKGVRSCMQMDVIGIKDVNENCPCITDILLSLEQVGLHYDLNSVWFKYKDQSDVKEGFESYSFWVYRYPHQLPIIRAVEEVDERNLLVDWITGKLLGYSDASMEEYLTRNVMNEVKADTTVLKKI